MIAHDLILTLRSNGYSIRADGQFIELSPAKDVPAELVAQIKQHKPEILAELSAETRRKKAVAMLEADPAIVRAVTVDDTGHPDCLMMTVAIRSAGLVEMLLSRDYDPFALLALIEQHGQTTH